MDDGKARKIASMDSSDDNTRSQLESLLGHIGLVAKDHISVSEHQTGEQAFVAIVTVVLPSGQTLEAEGRESVGKRETTLSACSTMLNLIRHAHPEYFQPWEDIRLEAQAGDALIKLAAYLAIDFTSAKSTSEFLQKFEANKHLGFVFDAQRQSGNPFFSAWGEHLSPERKGTLVEAWIWRRYGQKAVSPELQDHLTSVLADINSSTNSGSE
jgi:hypothetical protein